jgi:hypothetical protein
MDRLIHWRLTHNRPGSKRFTPLVIYLILLASSLSQAAPLRTVRPSPEDSPGAKPSRQPVQTPFIQHEEVRFVTLDLVVEQRGGAEGGGWHFARDLSKAQVHVLVGSQEMTLDLFENWCGGTPPGQSPENPTVATSQGSRSLPVPQQENAPVQSGNGSEPSQPSEPHKVILYFDFQQLSMGGRARAFQAATQWAEKASHSSNEVMILTGGISLRIVRPMLPASQHLMEDLTAARDDTRAMDMWAEGEQRRIQEILDGGGKALASLYTSIDNDIARRSLENMSRLMTLFDDTPGAKDMIYFSETIRLYPGSEYPFGPSPRTALSQDVSHLVYQLAARANERNVRIYGVQSSRLRAGKDLEEPLGVLSEETGGRPVYGTNDLGAAFGKMEEDHSCFYRVGFRLPSEQSGDLKTIRVRIGESGRGFRVRHRRSVDDPTRRKQGEDRLTAAFLTPGAARAFPVEVSLTRLFDHSWGSRVRIDVVVPADGLLALPTGDPNGLQMSVQIGGQVVPLRAGFNPAGTTEENPWADVDHRRETFLFNRQARIRLPPSRVASHRPTRIVYAITMDVPQGDYRVVVAVQDDRSGAVGAQLVDLHTVESRSPLGEIGIGIVDATTVIIQAPVPTETQRPSGEKGKSRISPAENSLPPKLFITRGEAVEIEGQPSFFYALCDPEAAVEQADRGSAPPIAPLAGWKIRRLLACGGEEPIELPQRAVPHVSADTGCAFVVDPLPAGRVKTGPCRLEVRLERPGFDPVIRIKEFLAVSSTRSSTLSEASPNDECILAPASSAAQDIPTIDAIPASRLGLNTRARR